jgi:ABC-type multidrug transport system permease subunit
MVGDLLHYVAAYGLTVSQEPFRVPLGVILNVAAIFFALLTTAGISREREQGILLVLSLGPITSWGYLLSWLASQLVAFFTLCVLVTGGLLGQAAISGLELPWRLIPIVALAAIAVTATLAFGILVGSLGWDTRGSIAAFVAVTLLLVGVDAVHGFLGSLTPEQMPRLLVPTSYTVAAVSAALGWLSPYGYLSRALDAFYAQDWPGYALAAGLALLYTVVLLVLARFFFKCRGYQP